MANLGGLPTNKSACPSLSIQLRPQGWPPSWISNFKWLRRPGRQPRAAAVGRGGAFSSVVGSWGRATEGAQTGIPCARRREPRVCGCAPTPTKPRSTWWFICCVIVPNAAGNVSTRSEDWTDPMKSMEKYSKNYAGIMHGYMQKIDKSNQWTVLK